MPVLTAEETAPEVAVNGRSLPPRHRLPRFEDDEPGMKPRWWLIAVRGERERTFAAELYQQRITYFLPLVDAEASNGNKRVPTKQPLFPGYVFVFLDEWRFCQRIPGGDLRKWIVDYTRVQDGMQHQLHQELSALRAVKEFYAPLPTVGDLRIGRLCEFIKPLALRNVKAQIVSVRKSRGNYLVGTNVSFLGASLFEVPANSLKLL